MNDDKLIHFNPDKSLRADAIRNRRLLLDTAERLFEQEGVEDVTMSAIAKEAGVGKGTLYRNFTDKAELCVALLDEDMRKFQQETLEYLGACKNASDCLKWFLDKAASYVIKHSELLLEAANQGSVNMLHHPAHFWWRQTIIGLLNRAEFEGDKSYIADMLYVMLDVQTIRFQLHVQHYEVGRIIAGLQMSVDRLMQTD